eukprot:Sspe_Gene.15320::Locus_5332_Transcript_1_2_Confidence_0.800_Length_1649::g.15320::m.15320
MLHECVYVPVPIPRPHPTPKTPTSVAFLFVVGKGGRSHLYYTAVSSVVALSAGRGHGRPSAQPAERPRERRPQLRQQAIVGEEGFWRGRVLDVRVQQVGGELVAFLWGVPDALGGGPQPLLDHVLAEGLKHLLQFKAVLHARELLCLLLVLEAPRTVDNGQPQIVGGVGLQHLVWCSLLSHLPSIVPHKAQYSTLRLVDLRRAGLALVDGSRVNTFRPVDRKAEAGERVRCQRSGGRSVPPDEAPVPGVGPLVVVPYNLHLVHELLLPEPRKDHHSEKPLGEVEPRGTPEVHCIDVSCDRLPGDLHNEVELEGVEVLLVRGTHGLRRAEELLGRHELDSDGEARVVEDVPTEGLDTRCKDIERFLEALVAP